MNIPSIPAAPLLAFTRFHAFNMFSRDRICSSRLACVSPCFPADSSTTSTRPYGVIADCCGSTVETHPTGSGLPAKGLAVLCRLLTSRLPGISPDKNVNSCCTIPAFTLPLGFGVLCHLTRKPGLICRFCSWTHSFDTGFLPTVARASAVAFL